MKAMVVTESGGIGSLTLQELPEPKPDEGQVAIRMEATAVSFADIEAREGRYHTPRKPPVVPGHDVAGVVTAVGPGVGDVKVGDRVTAISFSGSFAQTVIAHTAVTWILPNEIDIQSGAAFPTNGVTAYNLLTLAGKMQTGETVVIHSAAGGVGTTTIQLAKILGAKNIIGTVGSSSKKELVKNLGCTHVINYREDDFTAEVMKITNKRGADLILDSVAGSTTEKSLECLAPWGRIVVYGMSGGKPGNIPTNFLHVGNRSAIGYSTSGYRYNCPDVLRPSGEAVLELLKSRKIRMIISAHYPLHEANEALDLVESRKSTGRVILINS